MEKGLVCVEMSCTEGGAHHYAEVGVCCEDLLEGQDIWVAEAPVVENLPFNILVQQQVCSMHRMWLISKLATLKLSV